jgi:hypothetical protein
LSVKYSNIQLQEVIQASYKKYMHWKTQIVECLNSVIMASTGYISNVSYMFHMPSVIHHKNETQLWALFVLSGFGKMKPLWNLL